MKYFLSFLIFVLPLSFTHAQTKTSALYRVYNDGETKVESPHLDIAHTFMDGRATFEVGFAQDILTSSSSDVRSYSSRSEISDKRTEGSGTFSYLTDEGQLGWSYIRSEENDYLSTIYAFAGTKEFFEKNTTIFMSFAYGEDLIWASYNPADKRPMKHQSYSIALSQILSKNSIAQILYDLRVESGYLSSFYRNARLDDGAGGALAVGELHPITRNRSSIALKYNYFWQPLKLAFSNNARFYFDSWGVNSGTFEERITRKFGSFFDIALNFRYYNQTKAFFYEDKYQNLGEYYSGNKTLSNFDSYLIGVRPTVYITQKLKIYGKYEQYVIQYKNHTDLGNLADSTDDKALKINAQIIGFGLEGEF